MIEIELPAPHHATCDCCGGVTVKLTRFVYRDGSAHAIYCATFARGPMTGCTSASWTRPATPCLPN